MADDARVVKARLTDPRTLCLRLGLLAERASWMPQRRGVIIRCVWHDDRTPSLSVRLADDGTVACVCHACGARGDALSLIAGVYRLDVRRHFPEVLSIAAGLAGISLAEPRIRPPAPSLPPIEERTYPPPGEIEALARACVPVTEDREVSRWLASRGLAAEEVARLGLAMALVPGAPRLPGFAAYRGRPWTETGHRLIFPMWDHEGAPRSVRACRVVDGDSPKRLPPAGYRAHGLLLAEPRAVAMLAGSTRFDRLCVVEGEPDYLTHALRQSPDKATIGLVAGAWSAAFAQRIPSNTRIVIRTDHDPAGDKYAEDVSRSLRGRCAVLRSMEA